MDENKMLETLNEALADNRSLFVDVAKQGVAESAAMKKMQQLRMSDSKLDQEIKAWFKEHPKGHLPEFVKDDMKKGHTHEGHLKHMSQIIHDTAPAEKQIFKDGDAIRKSTKALAKQNGLSPVDTQTVIQDINNLIIMTQETNVVPRKMEALPPPPKLDIKGIS